jgi:hypothetical protein
MNALLQLVSSNQSLFAGAVRESEQTIRSLEQQLGVVLPPDVIWFWQSCGSGLTGAAPSARVAVADTLRYRNAVSLPPQYVVLDDRNDAGTVLLDTSTNTGAVIWVDTHAIASISQGRLQPKEHDCFPSFESWVRYCVTEALDEQP